MSNAGFVTRRLAAAVVGAGAVLAAAGTAAAAPGPGCMASDVTAVESQVAAAMTGYFLTHPAANEFFSSVQGLSKAEAISKTQAFLAANPQTQAEINAIRQPVMDLRTRCGIPTGNLIRGVL